MNFHLEKTQAKRKCIDCKSPIERDTVCMAELVENQFGLKTQSRCVSCANKVLAKLISDAKRMKTKLSA